MGKMPKIFFSGFHDRPVRNSAKPISLIAGIPLANRKTQIRATAMIETVADSIKTAFIVFSLNFIIKCL